MALDFTAVKKDEIKDVEKRLDEIDKMFDRDSGDSLLQIQDCLKCYAYFDTVEKL